MGTKNGLVDTSKHSYYFFWPYANFALYSLWLVWRSIELPCMFILLFVIYSSVPIMHCNHKKQANTKRFVNNFTWTMKIYNQINSYSSAHTLDERVHSVSQHKGWAFTLEGHPVTGRLQCQMKEFSYGYCPSHKYGDCRCKIRSLKETISLQ